MSVTINQSSNQRAALLIRSLMQNLRVSDHVVYPSKRDPDDKPKAIVASVLLRELDELVEAEQS